MFEMVKELDLLKQFTKQIAKINVNNFFIADIVKFDYINSKKNDVIY